MAAMGRPTHYDNPAAPLACEWLRGEVGAPQDKALEGSVGLWTSAVERDMPAAVAARYASGAIARAAAAALAGFQSEPAAAAAAAAAALAISPDAADAYNLRAQRCAVSLEEALGLYREAAAAALWALKPEFAPAEGRRLGMELRPLLRAKIGAPPRAAAPHSSAAIHCYPLPAAAARRHIARVHPMIAA